MSERLFDIHLSLTEFPCVDLWGRGSIRCRKPPFASRNARRPVVLEESIPCQPGREFRSSFTDSAIRTTSPACCAMSPRSATTARRPPTSSARRGMRAPSRPSSRRRVWPWPAPTPASRNSRIRPSCGRICTTAPASAPSTSCAPAWGIAAGVWPPTAMLAPSSTRRGRSARTPASTSATTTTPGSSRTARATRAASTCCLMGPTPPSSSSASTSTGSTTARTTRRASSPPTRNAASTTTSRTANACPTAKPASWS